MHLFPQLRKLEEKYSAELVVIGVHSAKFTAEKSTANVRKAVLRYDIEHPVVNDRNFEVWQRYSVRAWPTLMFIDPEGKVVGKHEGEISADAFDNLIGEMVSYFDQRGLMDRTPLPFRLERDKELERTLSFPGKLLADEDSGKLFIADSNHNRLLIASLDGRVLDVVGSGEKGLVDGTFADSQFNDPQGMALVRDALYVADTKNHAIRKVDLSARSVETIAGTGEQAAIFHGGGRSASLNSPMGPGCEQGDCLCRHGRVPPALASGPGDTGGETPRGKRSGDDRRRASGDGCAGPAQRHSDRRGQALLHGQRDQRRPNGGRRARRQGGYHRGEAPIHLRRR